MRTVIHLSGIEVFANHGVYPEEREKGQLFVVDLDVEFDSADAQSSDSVDDTIDYAGLAQLVHDHVASDPVNLLETLAGRILRAVFEASVASHATVTIHKPYAPMPIEIGSVSVTVDGARDEVAG